MKERAIGHGQRELYGNTDEIRVAYVSEDDVLLVSNNGVIMNCVLVGIYIFFLAISSYIFPQMFITVATDVVNAARIRLGMNTHPELQVDRNIFGYPV
jgi:hypothetical protein